MKAAKNKFYSNNTLDLTNVQPFAEGGNRLCFIHPENNTLCVKTVKPGSIKALRKKRSFLKNLRPDNYFDDNLNEYKAYQQPAISNGDEAVLFAHIPKCYGWQNTNKGMGLVLDYYHETSGAPCMTLEAYLLKNGFTKKIETKLKELGQYLRATELMTKNILPHNVIIATDGKLKIIDGLGVSSPFSIANFNKTAKHNYINRRIHRMFLRAKWEAGDKTVNWKTTEKQSKQ